MQRRSKTVQAPDLGLLALRVGLGGTLAAHGAQKLFGSFGGHGIAGTGAFFESVGFKPGKANAVLAGLGEGVGGVLLALGLATPAAGAAAAGTMAVATSTHKGNGFFAMDGGPELPLLLGLSAAALALGGPGRVSLDTRLDDQVNQPWMRAAALISLPVAVGLVLSRQKTALAAISKELPSDESGAGEPPAIAGS